MSSLIPSGSASGTGSMTLAAPVTNSNQTATLPDASGTVMVSGNMPAFSAYRSGSAQSISSSTWTKAQVNTEDFDTANAFDSTTNYRFTPQVAGYYAITASISYDSSSSFGVGNFAAIYKNGSNYRVASVYVTSGATAAIPCVSAIVYLNGSTDYVELYGYVQGGGGMLYATTYSSTAFSGALVRAA